MRALTALILAALLLAACGAEQDAEVPASGGEPAALTAAERDDFDRAVLAIQRHCRVWARQASAGKPLASEQAERASAAVETLVELVRSKPRAPIGRSADVRLRAGDIAESIEGANCDPLLLQRLSDGIAAAVIGSG